MRRIGDLLDDSLKRLGLVEPLRARGAIEQWEEIVGPQVAAHARALEVTGTILHVQVDHSAWLAQLRLLTPVILEQLNARLGEATISNVSLRIGSAPPAAHPGPPAAGAPEPPPRLSPEESREIDRAIAGIPDPSLRALLQELRKKQSAG